jgi:hypothetical protein
MRKFLIGAVLLFGAAACADKAQLTPAPAPQEALAKAEMVAGGVTNLTGYPVSQEALAKAEMVGGGVTNLTGYLLPSAEHNAGAASQPGFGETPTAPKLHPHSELIPKQ